MKPVIGLFGGTFDPVHQGHLSIAERFCSQYQLDKLVWIPANKSPLKTNVSVKTTPVQRYEMLSLAIKNNQFYTIDDFEIKRKTNSYTIDTIHYLIKKFKPETLYLLIGEDNARVFDQWKAPEEILSLVEVVVYGRKYDPENSKNAENDFIKRMHFLDSPNIDISSTEIRHLIRQGKDVSNLVSYDVFQYIKTHSLYV